MYTRQLCASYVIMKFTENSSEEFIMPTIIFADTYFRHFEIVTKQIGDIFPVGRSDPHPTTLLNKPVIDDFHTPPPSQKKEKEKEDTHIYGERYILRSLHSTNGSNYSRHIGRKMTPLHEQRIIVTMKKNDKRGSGSKLETHSFVNAPVVRHIGRATHSFSDTSIG
ncbi:hypothetical protein POVCU2_0005410 [Plasmodium ovale curtisi]|uniref:Uncharacterized protein n=1 Tax=Plasmodium ovale curtisi TaxID=864141 RepID=A0A1A8VLC4_PLAOA|nr:hypothetical protein POVCU2_0005410 [Plasmodium ovale curtisi]SBS81107.1 hypothetical protein POVCU1_004720 [Plasmodium ovale curtisi]